MTNIISNLTSIRERIAEAAIRCGRDPSEITLVAVTKMVPLEDILVAIKAGIKDIGENRIQEAKEKIHLIKKHTESCDINQNLKFHLVGYLQTNKVKVAVELFDLIHSVDRIAVAEEINKRASKLNKIQAVLVEVNTSGEATKAGVTPDKLLELVEKISIFPNLNVCGLMTIGPLTTEKDKIRASFRLLRNLAQKISDLKIPNVEMRFLSMGMSDDFEIAIEEGANMLRIGRAIFGERK